MMESPFEPFANNLPEERAAMFKEAGVVIRGLSGSLGGRTRGMDHSEALTELDALAEEEARFAAYPDVFPFTNESFAKYGWPVPKGFEQLEKDFRFYLLRFPLYLRPTLQSPFNKLVIDIEFGTNIEEDRLKPKVHLMFPNKKFVELLGVSASSQIEASGTADAAAAIPTVSLTQFGIPIRVGAEGEVKLNWDVGVRIGEFNVAVRRAVINHSADGAERAHWSISDTRLVREDDPSPIVILQVPTQVRTVAATGTLVAFHHPDFAPNLKQIIRFLSAKFRSWYDERGPVSSTDKPWENILPVRG